MQCPKCGAHNPAQARFCMACAAPLTRVCPECGAELPDAARFCIHCAAPVAPPAGTIPATVAGLSQALARLVPKEYADRLLSTRGQVQAERRMVTILFSDVKGSTAMAENLDPEDVMEIMDGAFDVLIAPIYRYEGTLARLMGDAILAFFGAPIAHEDDPERACRAALEIVAGAKGYAAKLEQERGITGFNVRVGINTGLVVVGEVGSDLRVEYTAMGDAINLASRMESAAEPGTVLITEATHKLVAPLFETEALGPIQVKGKAEPVAAFRLLSTKDVPGKVRGIEGLESPLVGREREFAALQEALQGLQRGVGGIVTIVGEAGIGKSRLVAEARRLVTGRAHPVAKGEDGEPSMWWVEGRCLSYGTSVAYLPWLDVLRSLLGATMEDSPEAVRGLLRRQVEVLCANQFSDVYPYLTRAMSLPVEDEFRETIESMEGERLKARTFRATGSLIECAAALRPVAIVLEDLHYADPTSLELLEQMLALTDCCSLLLICVFRPRRDCGCWRIKEAAARDYPHRHTDVWLQPLSPEAGRTLVEKLLGLDALPEGFGARVQSAAEGNPLYVEEILRGLIDQGAVVADEAGGRWRLTESAPEAVLPDSLQSALLARIDRLQLDTRHVLQLASVIGRMFLYRVLAAIAEEERQLDRHLVILQREQMIRERARIPELEYIFKHELTREAVYGGLLRKQRRSFHRRVAEALEQLYRQRKEEHVELLAYHWQQAGVDAKAVSYLIQAGDRARRIYASTEAIEYYTRALSIVEGSELPDADALAAAILKGRGQAHEAMHDMGAAREDLYRVLDWSRRSGQTREEAETLLLLIQPLLVGHQLDEAMGLAEQAQRLAESMQDTRLIARSAGAVGGVLCVRGDIEDARTYLQTTLDAGRTHGATDSLGQALYYSMMERNWVADFPGVLALTDETLAEAEQVGNPTWAYGALFISGLAQCGRGEYETALEMLTQADELAKTADMRNVPAELLNARGWVHQEILDLGRSFELNERCAALARDLGETESEANALVNLGVDALWMGDSDRAEDCFRQAHALLEKQYGGFRWRWLTRLLAAWGELCLARGETEKALEYARQCLELAERSGARKNMIKGWKLKGEALALMGDNEEASLHLSKAVATAEQIGNPPLLWKSHYLLSRVLQQLGRASEAQQHDQVAVETIHRIASSLDDPQLRSTFLGSDAIRSVLVGGN